MLDIQRIFNSVCDDCIGIILDYIDVPHDILKLIYYNKYYLYDLNRDDNETNTTTNSVQLLLYKKFYEKIMDNMEKFCKKSGVEWSDVSNLLNDSTILAGGFVLQSIFGEIRESTEIPLDFYYDEYINIYPEIDYNKLKFLIRKYATKKTITVRTDLDIFKIADLDIFSSNGMVEHSIISHADLGEIDIYRTRNNRYNMIICVESVDFPCVTKDYSNDTFLQILNNEECDVYVKYEIIERLNSLENSSDIVSEVYVHDCNSNGYQEDGEDEYQEDSEDEYQEDSEDEYQEDSEDEYQEDSEDEDSNTEYYKIIDKKYYKIKDKKFLRDQHITRNTILNIIMNQEEKVQKISSIPKEMENCQIACSKLDTGSIFIDYLLENNDLLAENVEKLENKFRETIPKDMSYSHSVSIAYDNLQARYTDTDGEKLIVSEYDLHKINYGNDIFLSNDGSAVGGEKKYDVYYCRTFNSDIEKKIMPFTYPINETLMLNLVYINQKIFGNTNIFIENDFDIDICKQQFNGKKIKLQSIANLVHKRFRYNTKHIDNMSARNNTYKYICFRKRTEKYKARGFTFLDEINVIRTVKNSLGINNLDKNILKFGEYAKRNSSIKGYYEYIMFRENIQK